MRRIRRRVLAAGVAVWATAAVAGLGAMMRSAATPDAPADTRPVWPAEVSIRPDAARPTLVVCLHPRCPCSDATLDALAELLASDATVTAYVLFAVPASPGPGWTDAALVERARHMPRVVVRIDTGGRDCAALGARTSGQTFLYDTAGRLSFAGGMTPGRGETGSSDGAAAVRARLADPSALSHLDRTPVFGCALYRRPPSEAFQ